MYNTYCIVRLIHRYIAWGCRSVETHGYIFLDLHKQTDRLYKLLDNQKNHTNREQSLTLTIYFYTITLTVKVENLVIWKGTSQLTFKVFGFFLVKKKKNVYIYRKSASRFSRGTVLNALKQSRINIMRGKNDATTYPDKPVSWIASLFRGFFLS